MSELVGNWIILWNGDEEQVMPVTRDERGARDPDYFVSEGTLMFRWHDGQELYVPWTSVRSVEYRPLEQ